LRTLSSQHPKRLIDLPLVHFFMLLMCLCAVTKLMDIHNETTDDGAKVARVADATVEALPGTGGRY
jgi:hypothetical protein